MFMCHICGGAATNPGHEFTEFCLCDRCQKWVWSYIYEDGLTLAGAVAHCKKLHAEYPRSTPKTIVVQTVPVSPAVMRRTVAEILTEPRPLKLRGGT